VRNRDHWRFNLGWHPDERWSFLSELSGINDGFPQTQYGSIFQREWGYSTQVEYARSARSQFTAGYAFDAGHRALRSRYIATVTGIAGLISSPNFDWIADMDEGTDTYNFGYHRVLRPGKTNLSLDALQSYARSDYTARNVGSMILPAGGTAASRASFLLAAQTTNYPTVVERLTNIKLGLDHKIGKDIWGKFVYAWENYDVFDFAQDPAIGRELQPYMVGVDPSAGSARSVFLGARQPSYDAHIFQISANYKF
jgi:hypothetical protein